MFSNIGKERLDCDQIQFEIAVADGFKLVWFVTANKLDPDVVCERIQERAEDFIGPETVLFRGAGPTWVYAMLTHAAHASANVATFYPQKAGYVVVQQHSGLWRPGQVIPMESVGMSIVDNHIVVDETSANGENHLAIVVGGPPHSGKSVFLYALYARLQELASSSVGLLAGCPDGEGPWSAVASPDVVKKVREKGSFGDSFTQAVVEGIKAYRKAFRITLIDVGGMLLPPNDVILREASHLLVLSSGHSKTEEWVEYGRLHDAEILGTFESRLVRKQDGSGELDPQARSSMDLDKLPFTGQMVNLDREGQTAPFAEAIDELARGLIDLVS